MTASEEIWNKGLLHGVLARADRFYRLDKDALPKTKIAGYDSFPPYD